MKARAWYRFENTADKPTLAELFIYDYIGKSWWNDDAVSAKQFIDELQALPATVTALRTRVNSLGGSVFDAVAIANAMRLWAKDGRTVETQVDGIAASAASVVIQAGSTVRIGDNAMVMVHLPWTIGIGNAKDFRKLADDLDAIRVSLTATYKWHSKLSDEELVALLEAETWMSATEAVEKGFATDIVEGLEVAASIDPRGQTLNIPEKYRARVKALLKPEEAPVSNPKPAAAADVLKLCAEAELDLVFARSLIDASVTADDVPARIAAEKDIRAKAKTRADEITALCKAGNISELAQNYIDGGMPVAAVKQQLTVITAKVDAARGNVDGSLPPEGGDGAKSTIDLKSIYDDLNGRTTKKKE